MIAATFALVLGLALGFYLGRRRTLVQWTRRLDQLEARCGLLLAQVEDLGGAAPAEEHVARESQRLRLVRGRPVVVPLQSESRVWGGEDPDAA